MSEKMPDTILNLVERCDALKTEFVKLHRELNRLTATIARLEAKLSEAESNVCDVCSGNGWLSNTAEGHYPCTCVSEMEPYQELKATIAQQQEDLKVMAGELINSLPPYAKENLLSGESDNVKKRAYLIARKVMEVTP